jgi:hypothetical protein
MKHDSRILSKLGLTAKQVRELCGGKEPPPAAKNYLSAENQRRMRKRLKIYDKFIYARYEEGYHPDLIAKVLGVSGESVKSRLRKAGFFDKEKPCERKLYSLPQEVPDIDLSE